MFVHGLDGVRCLFMRFIGWFVGEVELRLTIFVNCNAIATVNHDMSASLRVVKRVNR